MATSICHRPMLILLGAAVIAVAANRCVIPMVCDEKTVWANASGDDVKIAEYVVKRHFKEQLYDLQTWIRNIDGTIEQQKARMEEYKKRLATSPATPTTASRICPGFTYGPSDTICPSTEPPTPTEIATAAAAASIKCSDSVESSPTIFVGNVTTGRCPPNCGIIDSIWGTGIYKGDTGVCTAAVHDGKITEPEGGIVYVKKLPGQIVYISSTANGVSSKDFAGGGVSSFGFCDTPAC